MKMKQMKAYLLTLLVLCSVVLMCACTGIETTGNAGTTGTAATEGTTNGTQGSTNGTQSTESTPVAPTNMEYTVSVTNALGNPYTENIVVVFFQDGEQVAMQPVNAEGVATKELLCGDYTVELLFTDNKEYYFQTKDLTLTAENPVLNIQLAGMVGTESRELFADDKDHVAPYLTLGCTYVQLQAGMRNYFMFRPTQSGVYEFTVHDATGQIGYYGSAFFVLSTNCGEPSGEQSITMDVKESMIGTGDGGTTEFVLGIDLADGDADCIVSIARIGDYVPTPEERPWTAYEYTYTPTKYTLPEDVTIAEFDLTASADSYKLVYNEADGYYHLGSEDGPVVLVRLGKDSTYISCFGIILANTNVGVYMYDDDGNFVDKISYADCLLSYLGTMRSNMGRVSYTGGKLDDTYGVYPLTKDLEHIIKTYGAYMGWWDSESINYLFSSLPDVNPEIAWLLMCCYAQ